MAKATVTGRVLTTGGDAPALNSAWIEIAVVNPLHLAGGAALLPYSPPIAIAVDGAWTAQLEPLPLGGAYAIRAVVNHGQVLWERTVLLPAAGTFTDSQLVDAEAVGGPVFAAPAWAAALQAAVTAAAATTDAQMADRINTPGSATANALNATYGIANPTLVVTYNSDGSVASMTENGVVSTFTYNTDASVKTQTRAGITKTYSYDTNGNVTGAI